MKLRVIHQTSNVDRNRPKKKKKLSRHNQFIFHRTFTINCQSTFLGGVIDRTMVRKYSGCQELND